MALYIGANHDNVDDILQNVYLKLAEINNNEGGLQRLTGHTYFIFATIRSETADFYRQQKRHLKLIEGLPQDISTNINQNEWEEDYQCVMESLKKAMDTLQDYTLQVLELYYVYGYSIRDIAKGTGISTYSIFNTLKNAKQELKKHIDNDYKKYISAKIEAETISRFGGYDSESNESDWD